MVSLKVQSGSGYDVMGHYLPVEIRRKKEKTLNVRPSDFSNVSYRHCLYTHEPHCFPSRQMLRICKYIRTDHDLFLPCVFQFTIHNHHTIL
jgi:hypothetical protein